MPATKKRRPSPPSATIAALSTKTQLPESFLVGLGLIDTPLGVEIPYGSNARHRLRKYTNIADGADDDPATYWLGAKGSQIRAYGEDRLNGNATIPFLMVVEGETDAWTAFFVEVPVLGVPGSQTIHTTLSTDLLKRVQCFVILQENDKGAGADFAAAGVAFARKAGVSDIRVVHPPDGCKDLSDWYCRNATVFKDELREAVRHAKGQPLPEVESRQAKSDAAPTVAARVSGGTAVASVAHAEPEWPKPPDGAAYTGLAGEFVRVVTDYTEGDPAAILTQFLAMFGNVVGVRPHARVGAGRHGTNLFAAIVGDTAKARKGESYKPVDVVFAEVDPEHHRREGLSSGEGLIFHVRDAREDKKGSKGVLDDGVLDKRLLVVESEFGSVLRQTTRSGNILSAVLRQAWDGQRLAVMTRNDPITATSPHISIIAHITNDELRRELTDVEMSNGFANRFLWIAAKRGPLKPSPPPFEGAVVQRLAGQVSDVVEFARSTGVVVRDAEAEHAWDEIYRALAEESATGLVANLLARAEAQVLRLSLLYALLDCSATVQIQHLCAAGALWEYVERSVRYIWGSATGDPVADTIYQFLKRSGEQSRTDISSALGRNVPGPRIEAALALLKRSKMADSRGDGSGPGRPVELWRAI
jgi:hypothetical protein